jgi:imidazolonepropionase-like amidohydrolase
MLQAIKAGTLIDGLGIGPIKDATILIDGKNIVEVGPAASIQIPESAKVTDASGKTVMPGLIDTHVHIMSSSPSMEKRLFTPKAVAYFQAALNLQCSLQAGFTTLRDAGGADAGIRQALEMGLILGSRLVVSGTIGQTGGLLEAWFPSGAEIVDEDSWRVCDGVEEVRKTVRKVLRQGVDFIKIFTTGGVVAPQGSPFLPEWSPAELDIIVEEADRCGAGVMAHAESAVGIKNALRAGVTSIEHGNVLDNEAIDLFLSTGIYLVPTLHITKILSEQMASAGLSEVSRRKEARLVQESEGWFRRAYQSGVNIALGTDSVTTGMHGSNAAELSLMMSTGGLNEMEAIVAATRNAAACCCLDDRLGTLQPGKLADLLIVDGNPLVDITVLQDIDRLNVYQEGTLVS